MSWIEIDLEGVSAEMELVPEGAYVFTLLPGAKYSRFDAQKIEAAAKVAEGEFAGRVVYFTYGDPDKAPAMIGAFKKLEIALAKNTGVAITTGQDPVEYLNSVAGGRFIAPIKHRSYKADPNDEESETKTKAEIAVFKVKPLPEAA